MSRGFPQTSGRTKEAQLKRAAETIARLKQQLQDSSDNIVGGGEADKARAAAAEARVRVLEKQRADLLDGFRKQLKLVDILKRQKVRTFFFFAFLCD
jgi:cob(I)alamin adenosyltransferase